MSQALPRRTDIRSTLFGFAGSVVLHAAITMYVLWASTTPDIGVEFELPDVIEFGLSESIEATPASSTPDPADAETETPGPSDQGSGAADAGVSDAGIADAGVPDGGRPVDAGAQIAANEAPPNDVDGTGTEGTSRIPAGAQIALRVDMRAVRNSALAADIRRLLGDNPDWEALLGGSGIDPIDSIERIMLASPNLQRSRWVIAGEHTESIDLRAIVEVMAQANGGNAQWSRRHGVEVARWANPDATERVIAIIGPQHFSITRPDDLPRLLAIAAARQEPGHPAAAADALLALPEGYALDLEVDGARNFIGAGNITLIPIHGHAAIREENAIVQVTAEATYETEDEAEAAREHWESVREAYSGHPLVALSGMRSALRDAALTREEAMLRFRTELSHSQMRFILAFLEGALNRRRN